MNLCDILSNAQHGFRLKQSGETQLLLMVLDFASRLNDGKQTDTIILGFTKVFNKVSHSIYVLNYITMDNMHGPTLDWIKDFPSNTSQQVANPRWLYKWVSSSYLRCPTGYNCWLLVVFMLHWWHPMQVVSQATFFRHYFIDYKL